MHWILQTNLFKEDEWDQMVATLERFGLPYSVHKVIPFIGELVPVAQPPAGEGHLHRLVFHAPRRLPGRLVPGRV